MRTAGLLLAVLGSAAIFAALHHSGERSPRAAPPLPITVLSGPRATLSSLRGRPAIIDFFASWCDPCIQEAPAIERAARELAGRATVVAVDWSDSRASALAFLRRFRWSFPVLGDPSGKTGYAYGITSLPTTLVIDSRGRIVERWLGPRSPSSIVRAASSTT